MDKKVIDKSILLNWIQLSEKMGLDTKTVVSELDLKHSDTHITFSKFALFVNWAIEKTGNTNMGLLLGEQSNIAALGIVGQIIKSSLTIKQGLEQAIQFFNLFSNVLRLKMETTEHTVSLIFDMNSSIYSKYEKVCQQLLLTSMMFSLKEIYYLTLQQCKPTQVNLTFAPNDKDEIQTYFECELKSNAYRNILQFDSKILDLPIVYADYELMLVLEKMAIKRLTDQNKSLETFPHIVKSIMYSLMNPYLPNLKTVSNHLNLSARSLQRKLKAENTSYKELLNSLKKELAQDYLNKDLSVKETSYLLGYSEPSAFIKAFQNWHNKTPGDFQNHNK